MITKSKMYKLIWLVVPGLSMNILIISFWQSDLSMMCHHPTNSNIDEAAIIYSSKL